MKSRLQELVNLCKKDVLSTGKKYKSHGENENGDSFNPIWGMIIPHTHVRQGARSPLDVSEYSYGAEMAQYSFKRWANRTIDGIKGAVLELKKQGCNASLEPHKNAFNTRAKGFEILVMKGDSLSLRYAEFIAESFSERFPDRILRHGNGIKLVTKGDRGYMNLFIAKQNGMEVALLSESFFIDNHAEWIPTRTMGAFWKDTLVNV